MDIPLRIAKGCPSAPQKTAPPPRVSRNDEVLSVKRCLGSFVVAISATLSFIACAPSPIALMNTEAVQSDEGVVFGRVKIVSNGSEWENFSTIFGESRMSVLILPTDSSQGAYYPLRGSGSFFWHLPSGDYTIAGFEGITSGFFSQRIKGRIFARFKVVPGEATYIGTLTLLFVGNRYSTGVEDEYGSTLDEYRKRFPQIRLEHRKDLMLMEVGR